MRLRQKIKIIFIVLSMQLLLSGYMISRREMIDVSTLPERPDIVLNEICSINQYSYPNEIGEYFAWIELYNQSDMEVSLAGYGLTDCPDEGIKFVFGDVVMPPETYRLVYLANARATCFDTDSQYADFQLSGKGGEILCLSDPSGNITDSVQMPELAENISYAREYDGTGEWRTQQSTPWLSNNGQEEVSVLTETLLPPVFSLQSGFYEKEIDLSIFASGNGISIYYTTDGSEPDLNSCLYDGKIHISEVSSRENVYSARTDTSAAVYYDESFAVPDSPVDKGQVIRARAYDRDGNISPIVTGVFFVGYDNAQAYENMAVLSLVTDPSNLFDYDKGIYVLGRSYFESEENEDYEGQWQFMEANYRMGGRQTERPVHIDFFGENKELLVSQEAGMRVKGNFSRGLVQKSFNLYARKEYSGQGDFGYSFFDGEHYNTAVTLFSGGNDIRGKMMDYLAQTLAEGLHFDSMSFRPCAVFLDGEYWGFYYLTEKYDADFIEQYYDIDKADLVMIKDKKLNYGTREDYDQYSEEKDFLCEEDMAVSENYEQFCAMYDVDSFVDYYAFAICIGREGDWPGNNWAMWRTRIPSGYDKWRWMLYDVNFTCMQDPAFDSFAYLFEQDEGFSNLMRNPVFRSLLFERIDELVQGPLHESNVVPLIDRMAENNRRQMKKHYNRFYNGIYSEETFDEEVSVIRKFFEIRRLYVAEYVERYRQ